MTGTPSAPRGSGPEGRRLWKSIVSDFELAEHELALLRQAVRVADLCQDLQKAVDDDGLIIKGKAHPALIELRQQRILLARLVVALRVPLADDDEGRPPATAGGSRSPAAARHSSRTQRRGVRGVYAIKGGRP